MQRNEYNLLAKIIAWINCSQSCEKSQAGSIQGRQKKIRTLMFSKTCRLT